MNNKFEKNGRFAKQYNRFKFKEDYVIGYTNKNEPFYIDTEDYDKVKEHCWYKDNNGYFKTNIRLDDNKRKIILLHDYVMNWKKESNLLIDHIHGADSRHDNRKSNLRLVSRFVNNVNQKTRKDNTSGVKGVDWDKEHKKWAVRISVNNKRMFLGRYDSFIEAKQVREDAEEKYYGEYSYKNSMNK